MAFTYTECVLSSLEQLSLCPASTSLLFESNIHIQVFLSSWNIKVWSLLTCDISNLVDLLFAAFTPLNVFCCLRIVVSTPRCHVGCGWVSSPAAGDFPFLVATLLEGMGQAGNLRGAKQRNKGVCNNEKPRGIEMIRIDFSFRLYRLRTLKAKNV